MKLSARGVILAVLCCSTLSSAYAQTAQSGLALRGTPHYAADFTHFDYINPDAPKGGDLHLAALGTFDTVNPFTLKGVAADGVGYVFETLMVRSLDEPFSQYGWVAESVTVAADRSSVSFKLRPQARFHDGTPITPEDVVFSFEVLRDKGHPYYRSYYKDVTKVEKTGPQEVRFTFRSTTNAELPMIVGELPILSKKDWAGKDFSATTLDQIEGSGPYKIENLVQGRSISYARVKDYWAADLPVNKGRFNFDRIAYDYYRDTTVVLEALFAGRYDYRFENVAKNWALAYKASVVDRGLIKKQEIKNELPAGMQAFIMNSRRPLFHDRRVREALGYAFDFEWSNKNFAYGAYSRTNSYFENSELAAKGLPSASELKLLDSYRSKIPDEIFTKEFSLPKTDGNGDNRDNLRKAAELLRAAGWELRNGVLTDTQGQAFAFEIIENDPMFERWIQPFLRNLERLGIKADFRVIDTAQYKNRTDNFDFDMTVGVFPESLSPGNEQYDMWGSAKADAKGSRNLIGVHDPVVDALIDKIVHAPSRDDLVTASRALDRVLLWQYYVIPHWYIGTYRLAYWDKFGQPAIAPKYGLSVEDSWWVDPAKATKIDAAQGRK